MKVTFIGHATCLIEIGGKKILTDPIWANRIFFIKRLQKPGVTLEEILPVDLVLISHAHFDHFNVPTLKKINRDAVVVCAKNIARLLRAIGFQNVFDLDWWQVIEIIGLRITAVPAKHFGGRWQFWDRLLGYCGYVVSSVKENIYFAGDTAYDSFLETMRDVFTLDLALLPIGAYEGPGSVHFRHIHMDPPQALRAFQTLQPKYMIPIHFGTYKLSSEPIHEPEEWIKELAQEHGIRDQLKILKSGETFST